MNRETFFEWLNYHDAAFPGFESWWSNAGDTTVEARLQLWLGRVSQFSLQQMRQATELMFNSPDKPKFHSEHLDWLCIRLRPRPLLNSIDSRPKQAKCRLCNDTGMLTVIFREQRFTPNGNPLENNTGPVACKCPVGQWLNDARKKSSGGSELEACDLSRMDIPQPLSLSQREREEILARVESSNSSLATVLRKFMRTTEQSEREPVEHAESVDTDFLF